VQRCSGPDAGQRHVCTIARTHLRFGTTTLLATTMTAGLDEIEHALHGVAATMAAPDADAASIVGVHLEGPSSARSG
jgi:N-acetylglucosamine-6-phosphate deacetylase